MTYLITGLVLLAATICLAAAIWWIHQSDPLDYLDSEDRED